MSTIVVASLNSRYPTDNRYRASHQTDQVEQALDQTLSDLGLDYLDLYLMHWPVASLNGRTYIEYVDVSSSTLSQILPMMLTL